MEYVPCIGNSSYSFWWILLKLYRCFKDGLEICILFFQNPEIIFYHFFRIFNLDIFRALILQICIWSIYLVSATPPTVFGESFWNFTVVFRMVWRYAYCFLRILKLFFLHFNLDIFSSLYATDMYREYMPCIGNPAYSFRPILLKLYRYFAAFLWFHMRNLSLAGYNCSGGASCMACSFIYRSFWNFAHVFPMVWRCACGLDIILELIFITFSTLWTLSFSDLRFYESVETVGTLWAQPLIQFYTDLYETLHMFLPWSGDVHVVWIWSLN